MTDLIVWLARLALYLSLAWVATRFWKHKPTPLPYTATLWQRAVAWRAHLLYFGGWAVYLAYSLVLRSHLSLHQVVPTLAFAAIILGAAQFITRPTRAH